jgi:putative oxidoreductase
MNQQVTSTFDIVARVMMAALFLYSGFGKLMDPGAIATRLTGAGFPLPLFSAYVAIAIEFGAAATLIAGYKLIPTTIILAVYTVLATFLFHTFWTFEGAQRVSQTHQFLKNSCILAGLWFIARVALLETSRRSSSPVMAGRAVPAE